MSALSSSFSTLCLTHHTMMSWALLLVALEPSAGRISVSTMVIVLFQSAIRTDFSSEFCEMTGCDAVYRKMEGLDLMSCQLSNFGTLSPLQRCQLDVTRRKMVLQCFSKLSDSPKGMFRVRSRTRRCSRAEKDTTCKGAAAHWLVGRRALINWGQEFASASLMINR